MLSRPRLRPGLKQLGVGVALLLVDGVALLYDGLYGLVVCAVTGAAAGYVWLVLEPMRRLASGDEATEVRQNGTG